MGGLMSEAANPYAAPTARLEDVGPNPEAEAIRRAHISHEASIKAVGILYYLAGTGITIGAIATAAGARDPAAIAIVLLVGLLGVAQFFAGWGVRAFRPWGRIAGCVLSGIGLLGFPVGTLINAYILYLFLSKKGRTIFSPGYQEVIAATPHVKYKTSVVVWIFIALVLAFIVIAVGVALIGGK
jgi:hypothetical protein